MEEHFSLFATNFDDDIKRRRQLLSYVLLEIILLV
jgi:hypothetical protein